MKTNQPQRHRTPGFSNLQICPEKVVGAPGLEPGTR
jgi:hypothetical protein